MTATKRQPNNGSYDTDLQRLYWQGRTSVSTLVQVSPTTEYIIHISERPFRSCKWRWPKDLGMLRRPPCSRVVLHGRQLHCSRGSGYVNSSGCFLINWCLTGRPGFCVDLPNGDSTNRNQVQIWKCTDFDRNQIWTQSTPLD